MKIEYYCSFSLSTVFPKQDCGVRDASLLSLKSQENQGSEPHDKLWFELGSEPSPCSHSCLLTTSLLSRHPVYEQQRERWSECNLCNNMERSYFINLWLSTGEPSHHCWWRNRQGGEAKLEQRWLMCRAMSHSASLMVAMATPGHQLMQWLQAVSIKASN